MMKIIIFGIIIGYLIGLLLNYEYHGPDSNEIKKEIYMDDTGCYKMIPKVYACPIMWSMK